MNIPEFWTSLMEFISIELHGFPHRSYVNRASHEKKATTKKEPKPSDESPASRDTTEDLDDPTNAIPDNTLGQMFILPVYLERMMVYALLLCLDALLFEMTFMPLQAIGTSIIIIVRGINWVVHSLRFKLEASMHPFSSFNVVKSDSRNVFYFSKFISNNWDMVRQKTSGESELTNHIDGTPDQRISDMQVVPNAREFDNQESDEKGDYVREFLSKLESKEYQEEKDGDTQSKFGDLQSLSRSTSMYIGSCSKKLERMTHTPSDEHSDLLLNPSEVCGFMRFLALLLALMILTHIDTSRVYHNIRGQPFIKLYVIFNMLDICERLCRSFGRDCTDLLMRCTIRVLRNAINTEKSHKKWTRNIEAEECKWATMKKEDKKDDNVLQRSVSAVPEIFELQSVSSEDEQYLPIPPKDTSPAVNRSTSHDSLLEVTPKSLSQTSPTNLHFDGLTETPEQYSDFRKMDTNSLNSSGMSRKSLDEDSKYTPETVKTTIRSLRSFNTLSPARDFMAPYAPSFPDEHKDTDYELVELFMKYLLVVSYILFHSLMHLVRVLSLNIAINSSDSAMFLLLVTNNFAEIKSTVFKKFNHISLFPIVATDAVERFHLCFDAMLVFFKMSTVEDPLKSYLLVSRWLILMFGLEVLIDYFKHSFLLKFNNIPGDIHQRYNEVLMADFLLSRCQLRQEELIGFDFEVLCKGAYAFPHIPSRRLGFMPSSMLTLIVCNIPYIRSFLTIRRFILAMCIWLSLFSMKITISIILVAHGIRNRHHLKKLKYPMDTVTSL
ncbi:Tapt1 family protein [Babesia gibsoni]|uniref:Tapt1 family protein n=1 Tax=Babesia gibsoni TaxID=33632 RepID=A0AAD8LIL8_BABGI|nr:Tapt1 family protein [Babesia gibsoni]